MAIAYDATATGSGTATSKTISHTCAGSNRMLFAAIVGNTTDTLTGVTYNSVAMTLIGKIQTTGNRWNYLFRLIAPDSGANNLIATFSGSTYIEINSSSFTGVDQVAPEASGTNSGTSVNTLATAVTTLTDNAWVVQACHAQGGTITAGASTTQRSTTLVGAIQDSNAAVTPAGSRTLTFGCVTSNVSAIIAAFAPSAGGAATSLPPRRRLAGVLLTHF